MVLSGLPTNLLKRILPDAEKNQILAEARFLRGFYHFEAKKMWNKIPYVDETINTKMPKCLIQRISGQRSWLTLILQELPLLYKRCNWKN